MLPSAPTGRVERAPAYLWKRRPLQDQVDLKHNVMKVIKKQHEVAEQRQEDHEAHNRRSDMARRRNRVREQRARTEQRRWDNFQKEVKTGTVFRSSPRPPLEAPRGARHVHQKKDAFYYRRRGFLWSDLVHCPPERAQLVIPRHAYESERQLIAHVMHMLDQEDAEQEAHELRIQQRAAMHRQAQRRKIQQSRKESLALRVETLGLLGAYLMGNGRISGTNLGGKKDFPGGRKANSPTRSNVSGHQPGEETICGGVLCPPPAQERWKTLAEPRKAHNRRALAEKVGLSDLNGLLLLDPALEKHIQRLEEFMIDLAPNDRPPHAKKGGRRSRPGNGWVGGDSESQLEDCRRRPPKTPQNTDAMPDDPTGELDDAGNERENNGPHLAKKSKAPPPPPVARQRQKRWAYPCRPSRGPMRTGQGDRAAGEELADDASLWGIIHKDVSIDSSATTATVIVPL